MSVQGELISTAELADRLGESGLRIFDCTTRLEYLPPGSDAMEAWTESLTRLVRDWLV